MKPAIANIPDKIAAQLVAYIDRGRIPDSWIQALIIRADDLAVKLCPDSQSRMYFMFVRRWIQTQMPAMATGSFCKMRIWNECGGLQGLWNMGIKEIEERYAGLL